MQARLTHTPGSRILPHPSPPLPADSSSLPAPRDQNRQSSALVKSVGKCSGDTESERTGGEVSEERRRDEGRGCKRSKKVSPRTPSRLGYEERCKEGYETDERVADAPECTTRTAARVLRNRRPTRSSSTRFMLRYSASLRSRLRLVTSSASNEQRERDKLGTPGCAAGEEASAQAQGSQCWLEERVQVLEKDKAQLTGVLTNHHARSSDLPATLEARLEKGRAVPDGREADVSDAD